MANRYYTDIFTYKGAVYETYIDEYGNKQHKYDKFFKPSIFVKDNTGSGKYTDIMYKDNVRQFQAKSLWSYYNETKNLKCYNKILPKHQYIVSKYPVDIKHNMSKIKILNFDIENPQPLKDGFPSPDLAYKFDIKTIVATITYDNQTIKYGFGTREYTPDNDEIYYQFDDEIELLTGFAEFWNGQNPDVITGWNIDAFDIPFVIFRMRHLDSEYGTNLESQLSPINIVHCELDEKVGFSKGTGFRYQPKYRTVIYGVQVLDWFWLFKKYISNTYSSFKLDFIAQTKLDMGKIDFSDKYKSHYDFWDQDYQLFMKYNFRDVEIVDKLEAKYGLIGLQITIAYLTRVNYVDVYSATKAWQVLLYRKLMEHDYVLPFKQQHEDVHYIGAWTMHPTPGHVEYFWDNDFDSLYPHAQMEANMSFEKFFGWADEYLPELKTNPLDTTGVDERLIKRELDLSFLKDINCVMAANGMLYKMDEIGIIPAILEDIYNTRKKIKSHAIELKATELPEHKSEIANLNATQKALKVVLNSYYGAIGNENFELFDVDVAIATTLTSQWATKHTIHWNKKLIDPKYGYKVVYGDTDSLFQTTNIHKQLYAKYGRENVSTKDVVDVLNKFIDQIVNPMIRKNCLDLVEYNNGRDKFHAKKELIADIGMFFSAKMYVANIVEEDGHYLENPEILKKGISIVKSTTPHELKPFLEEAIKILLFDKDRKAINQYISNFYKKYMTLDIANRGYPATMKHTAKYQPCADAEYFNKESIKLPGTTRKMTIPIHIKAGLTHNRYIIGNKLHIKPIDDNEKFVWVYLKTPNFTKSNVFGFVDHIPAKINPIIDWDIMFEKSFTNNISILTEKLNISIKKPTHNINKLFSRYNRIKR